LTIVCELLADVTDEAEEDTLWLLETKGEFEDDVESLTLGLMDDDPLDDLDLRGEWDILDVIVSDLEPHVVLEILELADGVFEFALLAETDTLDELDG
jgi:hypothetical protein